MIEGLRLLGLAWLVGGIFSPAMVVYGQEAAYIPLQSHFAQMELAGDCGVYHAVATRARAEITENHRIMGAVQKVLEERRAALETCATKKGFKRIATEEQDEALAELCHDEYVAWLTPGARYEMLKEDIASATESLRMLGLVISERCSEAAPAMVRTVSVAPVMSK